MNPYLNSLNGWHGGFIAFWPVQNGEQIIRQVVTGGFGNDKFDTSIALVTTFGFSIGAGTTPFPPTTGAPRTRLPDFPLENELYAGSKVYAYGLTATGARDESNLVALYTDKIGEHRVTNPVTLNSDGRFPVQLHVDQSIILEVEGPHVLSHDSGAVDPRAFSHALDIATDGDQNPDVTGLGHLTVANTAPTRLNGFEGGVALQRLIVLHMTANTTLDAGGILKLQGSIDYTPLAGTVQEFIYDGMFWREIKRIEAALADLGIFSTDFSEDYR